MSGWFFSEEVSHLGHDAGLEGFSRRSVKVVQLRLERWWFQAIWKMGRWKSLATNERWIYVNAWNIVTLLVSPSWFQFQVFRSFIQTELIRKIFETTTWSAKKKKSLQMDVTHILPLSPPQKKKEKRMVQIWHQNSPSSPNHRECSNASKPGASASSKRGLEWWALIPAKNLEGSGGWINKGYWRQPWIPYDLDMMGRYFTAWIGEFIHHFTIS